MSEWISVEDRLPESQWPVVVYQAGHKLSTVGIFIPKGRGAHWRGFNGPPLTGVTHWMDLPAPPATSGELAGDSRAKADSQKVARP